MQPLPASGLSPAKILTNMQTETTESVKKKRGGARPGAGRPKREGVVVPLGLRVSPLAKERLSAYARARGISVQLAATQIFEALPEEA